MDKLQTVKIDADLAYQVKIYAVNNRMKMQDIIHAAISQYMEKFTKLELK